MKKRTVATMVLILLALPFWTQEAFPSGTHEPYQWILNMMSKDKKIRRAAATNLSKLNQEAFAPAMVDVLFYMPRSARGEMIEVLEKVTGVRAGNEYYDWVRYIGQRTDLASLTGYPKFKATLLSLIDPRYKKILYTGIPLRIRLEEVIWGGVALDGIPPVDAPAFITARMAKLKDNEKIFGVSLKGEARAYPLRYLSWHEMLNDRIGGEPITISY